MYETDEIDLVGVGGSTLERVQDPNNPLFPELRMGVDMCTTYVGFNNQEPPFDDPLVRQAFSYAVERENLIEGLFKDNVLPATGPLPPGMSGYTGKSEAYDFDQQKALSLLSQAGYEDPASFPAVTFTTSGYASAGPLVTALITMWQENLGLRIEPVLIDPFTYLDELYAGNTGNIFISGWCADYPDPENFLDVLFHSRSTQNLSAYNNPKVDARLQDARIEADVNERMAQYGQIEQLIVTDAPVIFLSHGMSAVLVKPHLQNYVETPIGIAQWHLVELNR
jgi:oligopeptide transport system substrate-binding protein